MSIESTAKIQMLPGFYSYFIQFVIFGPLENLKNCYDLFFLLEMLILCSYSNIFIRKW